MFQYFLSVNVKHFTPFRLGYFQSYVSFNLFSIIAYPVAVVVGLEPIPGSTGHVARDAMGGMPVHHGTWAHDLRVISRHQFTILCVFVLWEETGMNTGRTRKLYAWSSGRRQTQALQTPPLTTIPVGSPFVSYPLSS